MRLLPLAFVILTACGDWNRGPTLEELVLDFQTAEGILDAEDCGSMAVRECDAEGEDAAEAVQCFADALAACTPALLEIDRANGDGAETFEVLVIHPEGEGECAIQRFISTPNLYGRRVTEESCEGAVVPTDECEAPQVEGCVAICDEADADCG